MATDPTVAELTELRTKLEIAERLTDELIQERDRVEDMADKLAYAIAPIEAIGEHSSENCPWQNALDLVTPIGEVDELRARADQLAQQLDERTRQLNGLLGALDFDEKAVPA
ncbi:hypothetical protein ABZ867_12680 [Streptomyces cinnamoneus]